MCAADSLDGDAANKCDFVATLPFGISALVLFFDAGDAMLVAIHDL